MINGKSNISGQIESIARNFTRYRLACSFFWFVLIRWLWNFFFPLTSNVTFWNAILLLVNFIQIALTIIYNINVSRWCASVRMQLYSAAHVNMMRTCLMEWKNFFSDLDVFMLARALARKIARFISLINGSLLFCCGVFFFFFCTFVTLIRFLLNFCSPQNGTL